MSSLPPIGVYDDLTTREPSIAMWPTDDEFTCGIDQELNISTKEALHILWVSCEDAGE